MKKFLTRSCYFMLALSLFICCPCAVLGYKASAADRKLVSSYVCTLNADGWLGSTLNFKNAGDLEGLSRQNAVVGGHDLEPATLNFYSDNTFEFISPMSRKNGEIQLPDYTVTGNYINISGKKRYEDSLFYYGEKYSPTVLDTGLHTATAKKEDGTEELQSYTEKITIKSVNIYAAREVTDFGVNLPGSEGFENIKSPKDLDNIIRWDMNGGWLLVDIKGGITRRYSRNAGMTDLTEENIYIHIMYDVQNVQAGSMGIAWMYDLFGAREDIEYHTDAPQTKGADTGTSVPNKIVNGGKAALIALAALGAGGAAAASSAAAAAATGAASTAGNSVDPEDFEKKYTMYIYKDFGDTITYVIDSISIYAYIVETDSNGVSKINPELSQNITAVSDVDTISLYDSGIISDGRKHFNIHVADDNIAETVVISFKFTGAGGTVTNHMKFKVQGIPIVAFVSKDDYKNAYARKQYKGEFLLGEDDPYYRKRDVYLRLVFFSERPPAPTPIYIDKIVSITFENAGTAEYPNVYKMSIENITHVCDFPVGDFPIESILTVTFANAAGESADGTYKMYFCPKGIFFIPNDQYSRNNIKKDHICLPTNEFVSQQGKSPDLKKIGFTARTAYMNVNKVKDVDRDVIYDAPEMVCFPTPADEKCFAVLDPEKRKFSYGFEYKNESTSPTHTQMMNAGSGTTPTDSGKGEFTFTPLNTVVTESTDETFMCYVDYSYRKNAQNFSFRLMFGIMGERLDLYVQNREKEIEKLLKIIRLLQLDTLEEVKDRAYSVDVIASANYTYKRLIYFNKVNELGKKLKNESIQLQNMIHNYRSSISPVRLRFMRRALLEDAVKYWQDRADIDMEYCEIMEINILIIRSIRWLDDMAFTVCWYLLLKDKAPYTEPIATALKDMVLEWIGTTTQWAIGSGDYVNFWTASRWVDASYQVIENELLAAVTMKLSPKKIGIIAGGLLIFIVMKNFFQNYNSETKQYDMWQILKGILRDITVDTFKAICVGAVARVIRKRIYSDGEVNNFLRKTFGKLMKETGRKMQSYALASNIAVNDTEWMQKSVMWLFETANPEKHYTNFMIYATETFTGSAGEFITGNTFDGVSYVGGSLIDMFGKEKIDVDGKMMEIPYLAAFCLYVHDQFEKLGLNSVHFDYSGVLPNDMPYENRQELAKKLGKIPPDPKNQVKKEAEFILKGVE